MAFLFIYVREAHPSDGWQLDSNVEQGIVYAQPKTIDARRSIAGQCRAALKLTMPCVVDELDNRVDDLYAGWPERLYIIDADGRVAYAGRRGPWGFKPNDVASWLRKNVGPPARKD